MNTGPDTRMAEHGAPIERDGTAIDWDSECLASPLDPFLDELPWLVAGVAGWSVVFGAVVALLLGWLP